MARLGLSFDFVEPNQLAQLTDFLKAHVGDYDPAEHWHWVDNTCLPALERGDRTALAWWRHGKMIGDTVLSPHVDTNTLEIKNFRVSDEELQGRHLGDFMIVQTIAEGLAYAKELGIDPETGVFQLDTIEGTPVIGFFEKYGFRQIGTEETATHTNVIMQRPITA